MALHPCQPVIEALITVGKLFVIEPHQVQDGRVEVMDMDSIAITVDDVVSPFVGFAVAGAPAYTTSRHPNGKAAWVVVPTINLFVSTLTVNRSSEFTSPNHQSVFQHATSFQVHDQGSGSLIDLLGKLGMASG